MHQRKNPYLSVESSANLSEPPSEAMAKARVSTNPMYTGGAGGYSFYTRGGEQIVRQRKNNSNYGESASRTIPQMRRRVKWSNLVNCYRAMSFWQKKAYEDLRGGQTDYNRFMQLNVGRARVGLTKEQARQGCAVWTEFEISRGSLPRVGGVWDVENNAWVSDILCAVEIDRNATIGQVSASIVALNENISEGDNIALILFRQTSTSQELPYVACVYGELTLDSSSTTTMQNAGVNVPSLRTFGGKLSFLNEVGDSVGFAFVHSRAVSGSLKVSSAVLRLNEDSIDGLFEGDSWIQRCISTYGYDEVVPLNPN